MSSEFLEKIRKIIVTLLVLFISILNTWIAFCTLPVHAEEVNQYIYDFTWSEDNSGSWVSRFSGEYEIHSNIEIAFVKNDFSRTFVSGYSGEEVTKYGYYLVYLTSDKQDVKGTKYLYYGGSFSRYEGSKLYDTKTYNYGDSNAYTTAYSLYYSNFNETSSAFYNEIETTAKIFNSLDSAIKYVENGDTSGIINGGSDLDPHDDAYAFTGFSMSGKTATWTGTTERSYLLDMDVEEWVNYTYGFATSEDQEVSSFIDAEAHYPTSDKKLALPWDEMEANKKEGEFIRQVNIIPCYGTSGAGFYFGSPVCVYFDAKGNIEKVIHKSKPTDLNKGNMVYDSSIGYLQNVIYTEQKAHDGTGRQATFKWSTQKSLPSDAQVEIVVQNFYIEWFNKKTEENFIFKEYGEDCFYSAGSYSFNANTPVWTWLKEKEIDPFSIKTQSYGSTEYYLRIVIYDESDLLYHYGGWVKVDIKSKDTTNLPSTDVETGGFDDSSGLWNQDTTSSDSYHYSTDDDGKLTGNIDVNSWEDLNMNSFTWMYRNMQSMVSSLGEFPTMVNAVFGYLPVQYITAIGVLLVAIVLLRFLGR